MSLLSDLKQLQTKTNTLANRLFELSQFLHPRKNTDLAPETTSANDDLRTLAAAVADNLESSLLVLDWIEEDIGIKREVSV